MNQKKLSPKKLVFLRSIQTSFGGAEVFLKRLTEQLARENIKFEILHSNAPRWLASWIKAWWFNWQAKLNKKNNFYFSLDRIDSADIYRAGDGVHKAFLKTKSFSLNPLHLTYLILEKRCFKNSKWIICNSYKIQKEIEKYYPEISQDKISVIPNGINLPEINAEINNQAKQKICQEFSINSNLPLILFVGSGFKRKGVGEFLKIISQLKTPVQGLIVGKDKKIKTYQDQARSLGILEKISFTGQRKNINDFYLASDIFLFAPEYEPFGNVVLEAMAYGCVALTNTQCGMCDFMPEKYWITENTPKFIDQLLQDPEKLKQAQSESRAIASQYSIEKTAEEILKIIKKIMG